MRNIRKSTAYNLAVFMVDSTDHITGKTGLTLTITASKNGAAFASISPTVTELANGWYSLALTTSHTDTLGDLALHITGTNADPTDVVVQVGLTAYDALVTDTYAEPAQGAPGATLSLKDKLGFLFKAWRNKKTVDRTTGYVSILNDDAATVDHKATIADDGATFTQGEMATGP